MTISGSHLHFLRAHIVTANSYSEKLRDTLENLITVVFSVVMSRQRSTHSILSYIKVRNITSVRPFWECTHLCFLTFNLETHNHYTFKRVLAWTIIATVIIPTNTSSFFENIIDGNHNVSKQLFKAVIPYAISKEETQRTMWVYSFIFLSCDTVHAHIQ